MSVALPGFSPMSLKMDMVHFQDETLKDIRQMQSKLDIKYAKSNEFINENITKFDLKIKALEKKITELSKSISGDNLIKEKMESLLQFKEETQDTLFKRRAKYAEFEKKMNTSIDGINSILMDSVVYPAVIGKAAKFQTFHEFIDYVIQEISHLNSFKNKSQMDSMSAFKKKIDGALDTFKIQINNLTPKEITNQMIHEVEEKFESTLKLYDDRLQDTRVENANYSVGIQKKSEEMIKQMNALMKEQNSINKKIEKILRFEGYNALSSEISEINIKINKIMDILRDLASFHPEVKRNYPQIFWQKPPKKIISKVKEYIKGNINAEEVVSMKNYVTDNIKNENKYFSPENNLLNNLNINSTIGKRHSIALGFKPINIAEENIDFINKKFLKKKTANLSKQENIITNKLLARKKVQSSKGKNENHNKDMFNMDNLESPKKDNYYMPKTIDNNDLFIKEKEDNNNIIEEEKDNNKKNNYSKYSNIIEEEKDNNNNKNNYSKYSNIIEEEYEVNNKSKKYIHDDDKKIDDIKENEDKKSQIITEKKEETIKDEVNKNNNIKNIKENKPINNQINSEIQNISKNDSEKKKEIIANLKQYNNKSDSPQKDKEKGKDIFKNNIIINSENKNFKTRNNINNINNNINKLSLIKEEPYKNTFYQSSKKNLIISNMTIKLDEKSKESLGSPLTENKNKKIDSRPKNQNINIISIKKKLYNTYSNFPKINHDYKSTSISKDDFTSNKTISLKKPKKILLANPDDLPLNYFDKINKEIFRNDLKFNIQNKKINGKINNTFEKGF